MSTEISTLSDFIEWTEQFNDGQYLFRGVSKASYKIEASACRRLPKADRNNSNKLLKINQEMLEKAKRLGHDLKDGHQLSDLELLAELQHFGAATCLIDFTRNPLFALWIACQRSSSDPQEDGKVVVLQSDDPVRFRTIDYKLSKETLRYFFELHNDRYPLYQWEPKYQNNRIIAQQSVFVFGGAEVELTEECVVVRSCKGNILNSLEKSLGVTEASMFPDFYGFANLHSQYKHYIEPNAKGYLSRGVDAHLKGDLDDAIVYYTEVISLQPNTSVLRLAYINRGLAYRAKRDFDNAISDYNEAIELDPNDTQVYILRGGVYARKRDFDNAISDYNEAIELDPNDTQVYSRRARVYARKHDFNNAIKDYTKAMELEPDYVKVYYNRGTAYRKKGEFDDAIKDYSTAIRLKPDRTSAYNLRGTAYRKKGDFDNAIKDHNTAIKLKPNEVYGYNGRGKVYTEKGDFDNAIKDYNTAIKLKPDDPYAYHYRAVVWLHRREWKKAKSYLTTATDKKFDIVAQFHKLYEGVTSFEQKTGIQLPEDIAEMLTQQ